jgi:hypothetical protein
MRFRTLVTGAFAISLLSLAGLARRSPAETSSNTTAVRLILDKEQASAEFTGQQGTKWEPRPSF